MLGHTFLLAREGVSGKPMCRRPSRRSVRNHVCGLPIDRIRARLRQPHLEVAFGIGVRARGSFQGWPQQSQ